jgi:hypothetical protein
MIKKLLQLFDKDNNELHPKTSVEFVEGLMEILHRAIPSGLISIWSGSANNIPEHWVLCNGQNGTPDLRDKFVIGGGQSYAPHSQGGTLNHTHPIPHTHNNPTTGNTSADHTHNMQSHTHTMNNHNHSITSHFHNLDNNSGAQAHIGGRMWMNGMILGNYTVTRRMNSTVAYNDGAWTESIVIPLMGRTAGITAATNTGNNNIATAGPNNNTTTGHSVTHNHTIGPTLGTNIANSGNHSTLPPYYSLCYIMKI